MQLAKLLLEAHDSAEDDFKLADDLAREVPEEKLGFIPHRFDSGVQRRQMTQQDFDKRLYV
jgi:hypothetical protein